jgi:5-methyltetrahydrofolate--homocysteine methyltransferase
MLGGCCGTTPSHTSAIAKAVEDCKPRPFPEREGIRNTRFSGLELLEIRPESNFIMIGERTNVTGSAKFLRLIKENKYDEALEVALDQVRGGANIIDVNFDESIRRVISLEFVEVVFNPIRGYQYVLCIV